MSERRLARDPLADLLDHERPGGEIDRAAAAEPAERQRRDADSRGVGASGRITAQVETELAEQVRDAVMWLHSVGVHTTISAIAAAGLRTELARLAAEHRSGRPFPPRHADPPVGRPPK